jgi:hypothetical protein
VNSQRDCFAQALLVASRVAANATAESAVAGGPQGFDALLPAANLGGGTLKGAHERHQVLLLLCGQLVAQDQIEEFDGIIQRQQPLIM